MPLYAGLGFRMNNNEQTSGSKPKQLILELLNNKRKIAQCVMIIVALVLIALFGIFKSTDQTDLAYTILGASVAILAEVILNIFHYRYITDTENEVEKERRKELNSEIHNLLDDEHAEIKRIIDDEHKEMIKSISEVHNTMIHSFQYCTNRQLPFEILSCRNDARIDSLINNAKERIWIMNTNASYINTYHSEVVRAVNRGVSFKLLTLNPKNLFIVSRYHELGLHKPKVFYDEITSSLTRMRDEGDLITNSSMRKNYEIRLTTCQPTNMVFIIDEVLIVGFILTLGRSHNYIHLKFDISDIPEESPQLSFLNNFKEMWDKASELDSEDYPDDIDLSALIAHGRDNIDNKYSHIEPEL